MWLWEQLAGMSQGVIGNCKKMLLRFYASTLLDAVLAFADGSTAEITAATAAGATWWFFLYLKSSSHLIHGLR